MRHILVHLPDRAFDEKKKTHFDDTQVVDMVHYQSGFSCSHQRRDLANEPNCGT